MKNNNLRFVGIILFILFIFIPLSCTKNKSDVKEVRVGYYPGWPCTYQIAQAKGWFEKEMDVKVTFMEFDVPSQIATAMISGDLDLAYSMGSIPFVIGVTKEVPYKLVGVAVSYLESDNCVLRNGSGIDYAEDLAGAKVAVPFGSTSHYNLLFTLNKIGIDPADLDIYDMAPQDITAAMKRGDIDCGCAWEPAVSAMLEDGKLLVDNSTKEDWGMKVFDIVVARNSFADENPELVTKFLQVVDQSTDYYRENPEESFELIGEIAGLTPEKTAGIMKKMEFLVRDEQLSPKWMGTKNQKGEAVLFLEKVAEFLEKEKEIEEALPDYGFSVDTSFYEKVKKIAGQVGEKQSYHTLNIEAVCKSFSDENSSRKQVLDSINLEIKRDDFVVLLGPSGCGKTTLLNIIAGYIEADSGEVLLDGTAVNGPCPERGVVFQDGALFEWMTVIDNAAFGLKMRGMSLKERNRNAMPYLEMVGLENFADYPVYNLSGGMQQRLALVRTLVTEPSIVLLDEPLGALDALTRQKMQLLLLDIWNKSGNMFFLITHDVEEAILFATDLYIMSPSPGKIIKRFSIPFSRKLKGEDPRALKKNPDFILLREEVLGLIWDYD